MNSANRNLARALLQSDDDSDIEEKEKNDNHMKKPLPPTAVKKSTSSNTHAPVTASSKKQASVITPHEELINIQKTWQNYAKTKDLKKESIEKYGTSLNTIKNKLPESNNSGTTIPKQQQPQLKRRAPKETMVLSVLQENEIGARSANERHLNKKKRALDVIGNDTDDEEEEDEDDDDEEEEEPIEVSSDEQGKESAQQHASAKEAAVTATGKKTKGTASTTSATTASIIESIRSAPYVPLFAPVTDQEMPDSKSRTTDDSPMPPPPPPTAPKPIIHPSSFVSAEMKQQFERVTERALVNESVAAGIAQGGAFGANQTGSTISEFCRMFGQLASRKESAVPQSQDQSSDNPSQQQKKKTPSSTTPKSEAEVRRAIHSYRDQYCFQHTALPTVRHYMMSRILSWNPLKESILAGNIGTPEPVKLTVDYINRYLLCEAWGKFPKCCMGKACAMLQIYPEHPIRGNFIGCVYISPDKMEQYLRSGVMPENLSSFCYFDLLIAFNAAVSTGKVRGTHSPYMPPFYHLFDQPNGYNSRAMKPQMSDDADPVTYPLRHPSMTDFEPTEVQMPVLEFDTTGKMVKKGSEKIRSWHEKDYLFAVDRNRESNMNLVNASSRLVFTLPKSTETVTDVLRRYFDDALLEILWNDLSGDLAGDILLEVTQSDQFNESFASEISRRSDSPLLKWCEESITKCIGQCVQEWKRKYAYLRRPPIAGDYRKEEQIHQATEEHGKCVTMCTDELLQQHEGSKFKLALDALSATIKSKWGEYWRLSYGSQDKSDLAAVRKASYLESLEPIMNQAVPLCIKNMIEPREPTEEEGGEEDKMPPLSAAGITLAYMRLADMAFRPIEETAALILDCGYHERMSPSDFIDEIRYLDPLYSTIIGKNSPIEPAPTTHSVLLATCLRISVARYLSEELVNKSLQSPSGFSGAKVSSKVKFADDEKSPSSASMGTASSSKRKRSIDSNSEDEENNSSTSEEDESNSSGSEDEEDHTTATESDHVGAKKNANSKTKKRPTGSAFHDDPQFRLLKNISDKLNAFCNAHAALVQWFIERRFKSLPINDDVLMGKRTEGALIGTDMNRFKTTSDGPLLWNELNTTPHGPHATEDHKYIPYSCKVVHRPGPGKHVAAWLQALCAVDTTRLGVGGVINLGVVELRRRVFDKRPVATVTVGGVEFLASVVFGEFRAFVISVEERLSKDASLMKVISRIIIDFNNEQSFGRLIPPFMAEAIELIGLMFEDEDTRNEAEAINWASHSIVVAFLLRIYIARVIYISQDASVEKFLISHPVGQTNLGDAVNTIREEIARYEAEIWGQRARLMADVDTSRMPKYDPKKHGVSEENALFDMEAAHVHQMELNSMRENMYMLHRFQVDHVQLMDAIEHCLETKDSLAGPESVDIISNAALVHPDTKRLGGLSIFDLYYPHDGLSGLCEDLLIDCSKEISNVKFVVDASSEGDSYLDAIAKVLPVVCMIRGMKEKNQRAVDMNPAYAACCVQAIACSFTGGYRTSAQRMPAWMCMYILRWIQGGSASLAVADDLLLAYVLRENAVFHIRNNISFHDTIASLFPRYQAFEKTRVPGTMDRFRKRVFNRLMAAVCAKVVQPPPPVPVADGVPSPQLAGACEYQTACCRYELDMLHRHGLAIDRAVHHPKYGLPAMLPIAHMKPTDQSLLLDDVTGSSKKSKNIKVYRRPRVDFVKFISKKFKEIAAQHCTSYYFHNDLQFPDLASIIDTKYQLAMVHYVQTLDASVVLEDPSWVHAIGLKEGGHIIKRVYGMYINRAPAKDIRNEIRSINFPEFLQCFMFFYYLRAHYSRRFLPFTRQLYEKQLVSRAKLYGLQVHEVPLSLMCMYFCSPIGCGRVISTVAQINGPGWYGNDRMSIDISRGIMVCKPRKPTKGTVTHRKGPAQSKKGAAAAATGSNAGGNEADELSELDDEEDDDYGNDENLDDEENDLENMQRKPRHVDVKCTGLGNAKKEVQKEIRRVEDRGETYEKLFERRAPEREITAAKAQLDKKITALKTKKAALRKFVVKASRQLVKQWLKRECSLASVVSVPILGGAIVHNKLKEKHDSKIYTICPSENCGRTTLFSTDMFYANGFSCGYCDAELRENLVRPRCASCGLIMYVKTGQVVELKTFHDWRKRDSEAAIAAAAARTASAAGNPTAKPTKGRRKKNAKKDLDQKRASVKITKKYRAEPGISGEKASPASSSSSGVPRVPIPVLSITDDDGDDDTSSNSTTFSGGSASASSSSSDIHSEITSVYSDSRDNNTLIDVVQHATARTDTLGLVSKIARLTAGATQMPVSSFAEQEVMKSHIAKQRSRQKMEARMKMRIEKRLIRSRFGKYARSYSDQWSFADLIDEREAAWTRTYFCGHCALRIPKEDLEIFSKQQLLYVIRTVSQVRSAREYLAMNSS